MGRLSHLFKLDRDGLNWRRALFILAVSLLLLLVFYGIDESQYFLSALFAVLFVGVSDPGGAYGYRAAHMAGFAAIGALLTALGFGIGTASWGWVVLAALVITLVASLAVAFGLHRYVAAFLLNIWFVIALAAAVGYELEGTTSHTWAQTLSWLAGSALWLAFTAIVWLARGRTDRARPIQEIPEDMSHRRLSRQVVVFAAIRAIAVTIGVAIAFGFGLPNADWIPIATLVAMQSSLDQTTFRAEQRLAGALLGAILAAVLLLAVDDKHVLEAAIIVCLTGAVAIRMANYALYTAGIAAGVLIALDLPHPSDLSAEGRRVLSTFIGVAIAVCVMLLASLLSKRSAKAHPPPASPRAQPGS